MRAEIGKLLRQSHRRLVVPEEWLAAQARHPRLALALVLLVWGGGQIDTGLAAPSATPDPHPAATGQTRTPAPDPYPDRVPSTVVRQPAERPTTSTTPASGPSSPVTTPSTPEPSRAAQPTQPRRTEPQKKAVTDAKQATQSRQAKPSTAKRSKPSQAVGHAAAPNRVVRAKAAGGVGQWRRAALSRGAGARRSGARERQSAAVHEPRERPGAKVVRVRRVALLAALVLTAALGVPGSAAAAVPAPGEPTCSPGPADCFAWHNATVVTVTWPAPPPGSGIVEDSCDPEAIAADTDGTWVTCTWWAPDMSTYQTTGKKVRRDATPPTIDVGPSRGPDHNGWYNSGLSVNFSGGDNLSGLVGCTPALQYAGPDSGVASVTGSCTDHAGNVRSAAFTFQYDATAPTATAKPDRQPDSKGWYNHKVTVGFDGSDGDVRGGVLHSGRHLRRSRRRQDRRRGRLHGPRWRTRARGRVRAPLRLAPARDRARKGWTAEEECGPQLGRFGRRTSYAVLRRPGLHGARFSTVYSGPKRLRRRTGRGGRLYRYTVTAYDEAGNADLRRRPCPCIRRRRRDDLQADDGDAGAAAAADGAASPGRRCSRGRRSATRATTTCSSSATGRRS